MSSGVMRRCLVNVTKHLSKMTWKEGDLGCFGLTQIAVIPSIQVTTYHSLSLSSRK